MVKVGFFASIIRAQNAILSGILITLGVSFAAILLSTLTGLIIGFLLTYANRYWRLPFRLYVDIVRGLPGLVTIFAVYYYLDFLLQFFGLKLSPIASGVIALSVTSSAHVAEITRGALQAIPSGQTEAGKAIGLRFYQILMYILLPQSLIRMLPPWINTVVEIVKGSSLLALIGIVELLLTAQQLIAKNNYALRYYSFIGLIYFLINFAIEKLGKYAEKKLRFE